MAILPKSRRQRAVLLIGAKLVLAAVLLAWLAHSGAIAPGVLLSNGASLSASLIAGLCVLAALALGVYRWRLVMGALGVHLTYARSLQVYWIGAFASTFLPGAATGDVLRAFYVARESPDARARAVVSVVIDRVFGLLGFMLSGLALILMRFDALRQSAELRGLALKFLLILVTALLSLLAAAWIGKRLFQDGPMARVWGKLGGARRAAMRRVAAFSYPDLWVLFAVLGISLMIPTLLTCGLLPFISDVTLDYTNLIEIGISSNAAQVANTIPLTPGGIGVGEGVFEYVLALLRQPAPVVGYATAFLSLRLITAAVNAFGGVLFFLPGNILGARAPAAGPPEDER
ncbi:lysylphosphatidylglycerol synthase transmembrane domain-containing protein [Candidatus Thiodictyon syntrophicum]|jgi:uncharacterized membrane protein YbhN (UPF0104 family)|uniref:TIGR00374 family protein n=1 Tax=Candidatus Thiodictyon syntrophicum TaxID=1166950 RepID=A0A2K8UG58_9GAMM|nr:lysylphosphatidylglycerol synthase transmembrane domain-containing protein [Candidatus Thiodictyon syntrophicum]AUB84535.1 hypothetical protein THSYN_28795 [Candidatus Thiodictyon syntrophicum]